MNPTLDLMDRQLSALVMYYSWKKMYNRRESVTTDMIDFLVDKGKKYKDEDNIYSSMGD